MLNPTKRLQKSTIFRTLPWTKDSKIEGANLEVSGVGYEIHQLLELGFVIGTNLERVLRREGPVTGVTYWGETQEIKMNIT